MLLAVAVAVAFLGIGCANPGAYWTDRGLDFVDCFKVSGGIGMGLDVHARVTDYFSMGFGFADTVNAGFNGRRVELTNQFHAGVIGYDLYVKSRFLGTGSQQERVNNTYASILGIVIMDYGSIFKNAVFVDRFDIEVAATLVYLNARVGFKLGQFADFLLGWFGVDIGYDDTPPEIAAATPLPPEPAPTGGPETAPTPPTPEPAPGTAPGPGPSPAPPAPGPG
jgi:hypothetical protein